MWKKSIVSTISMLFSFENIPVLASFKDFLLFFILNGVFFQYYSHDDKHVFTYVKDWIFKQRIVF